MVGLIILMFSIFIFISGVSFFYTGGVDQSKIEGLSIIKVGNVEGIENWTGVSGAVLCNFVLNKGFGVASFFLLLFLIFLGLQLMRAKYVNLLRLFIICFILTVWTSITLSFFFGDYLDISGINITGQLGLKLLEYLIQTIGVFGTALSIIIVFILIMIFSSSKTIPFLRNLLSSSLKFNRSKPAKVSTSAKKSKDSDSMNPVEKKASTPKPIEKVETKPVSNVYEDYDDEEANRLVKKSGVYDPTADLPKYKYPTVDLLKEYDQTGAQADPAEQKENKNRIIKALGKFGIKIQSIEATVGPTVTLYEIVPVDGVRVSKIKNLEDDIAMSLEALGIRIMAPMPGKGTVGIEVPNKEPQIVSMHSIISSPKFQASDLGLPIAFGRTILNEVFMVDLTKLPHLLVAGATGQGKSVGLNVAITSLLYKKHPAELKFVLIDPKMVEFTIYSTIEKHFLAKLPDAEKPIVTDFSKVIYTLNALTKEMDERYELLEKAGSRNLKEYNEKFVNRRLNPQNGHKFLPYIVVIIDEFGDLILTAGKEIEQPIARIAQKARAVGIHMIIATQRPTTNIITGTIKANFPARVAFRVISSVDSRTILDGPGANQLIGRGDMLFFQGSDMTRVQCAFVDTPEVERISKFIGNQLSFPTAYLLPEYVGEESGS